MRDPNVFDTLILIALPASGKSEVRKFMRHGDEAACIEKYHLGKTLQLDDFPYVHFMREVDDALEGFGRTRIFYPNNQSGFNEPRDWGALLRLVSQDYDLMTDSTVNMPEVTPKFLFERMDKARAAVGAPEVFSQMDPGLVNQLDDRLAAEAKRLGDELLARRPADLKGHTVVIEFARGGPQGASMPLSEPHGYGYALQHLSPAILNNAAILYIWVSPEESRRKNIARADPNDPGSILHHSCPESVMINDYGTCDLGHLLESSSVPGTVEIVSEGQKFNIPAARFDNRNDLTTFVRDDENWKEEDMQALENGLAGSLKELWAKYCEA